MRDWFSEQELRALAISMVTRMERAIVIASGACQTKETVSEILHQLNI